MEYLRKVVRTNKEPDEKEVLWVDTAHPDYPVMKYYENGNWKLIRQREDGVAYIMPYGGIPYSDLSQEVKMAIASGGAQANWNQTNSASPDFIWNKPYIPTALADLTEDSSHKFVSATEKTSWNNKADSSDIPNVSGKADKVQSAVEGHIATLDSSGNLVDSGKGISDINPLWGNIQGSIENQTDLMSALGDKYEKPSTGIPASDLADGIIPDISGKADAATTLAGYGITDAYTKTEVDGKVASTYKPAGSVADVAGLGSLTAANLGKVYNFTASFTTTSDFVEGSGKTYPVGTNVAIVDVGTVQIPSYKYDVLAGFVDLSGYYQLPNGGIPKTDLASAVQTSLGKADTALQSFTETDPTVPSWAKASSKPSYDYSEISNTPAIPDELADLADDSTHRVVTDAEKTAWNNIIRDLGRYADGNPITITKWRDGYIFCNPAYYVYGNECPFVDDEVFVGDGSYGVSNPFTLQKGNIYLLKVTGVKSNLVPFSKVGMRDTVTAISYDWVWDNSGAPVSATDEETGDVYTFTLEEYLAEYRYYVQKNGNFAGYVDVFNEDTIDGGGWPSPANVLPRYKKEVYYIGVHSPVSSIPQGGYIVFSCWESGDYVVSGITADITGNLLCVSYDVVKELCSYIYHKPSDGIPASDLASGVIPTVPTALSQLSDDSTHRLVTDTEKSTWNGKQDAIVFNTAYNASSNKAATMSDVPDAVEANPTVPSGTTPTALSGLKIGSSYYGIEAGGGTVTDVTVGGTSVVDGNGVAVVPDIPTVNNATLTVKMNSASKGTFTANASTDVEIDLGTVVTSETSLSKGSTTGDGNAVTDISVSGHQITLTKGTTFLTSHQDITGKADKVSSATSGHLAGLDSNGNLTDSGKSASDFQPTIDSSHKLSYTLLSDTPIIPAAQVQTDWNASSGMGVLLNKPTIPTVPAISTNIQTDKTSTTMTASPSAVYNEVHPAFGSSQPAGGMLPNVLYKLGTLTGTVSITLAAATDATIENEYKFTFTAGSTAPTITWPASITGWAGNCVEDGAPVITGGNYYEVSVMDGIALIAEVEA